MQTLYAKLFEQHAFAIAIHLARLELHNDKTCKAYFNQQIDLEDTASGVSATNGFFAFA